MLDVLKPGRSCFEVLVLFIPPLAAFLLFKVVYKLKHRLPSMHSPIGADKSNGIHLAETGLNIRTQIKVPEIKPILEPAVPRQTIIVLSKLLEKHGPSESLTRLLLIPLLYQPSPAYRICA